MTTQLTTTNGFAPLSSLEVIRTTGLRTFEACPYSWAMQFLRPDLPERRSAASNIGTAAHSVIEATVRVMNGEQVDESKLVDCWRKIPADESDDLSKYNDLIATLVANAKRIVGIEHEFRHMMPGIDKPIKGTLDLALDMGDGKLLIVDHKTNRDFKPKEWWQADIQPLLYAWGARKSWPEFTSVHYLLGHINVGIHPRWETDPIEDEFVQVRVYDAWRKMCYYDKSGVWPMSVWENCKWCPAYEVCPERREASAKFLKTVNVAMSTTPVGEKLKYAKSVLKLVEDKVAQLEEELRAELAIAGKVVHGDVEYSLKQTSTRKIQSAAAMLIVEKWLATATDEEKAAYSMHVDDLFTTKVGGLDKIETRLPGLHALLSDVVVDVPGKQPRLEARPLKPSEGMVQIDASKDFG